MEIIYFLVFIGVCFLLFIWASGRPKKTSLSSEKKRATVKSPGEKLTTPPDSHLAHKADVWKARQDFARDDLNRWDRFKPRSETGGEPEYDGYSHRDRHHLMTKGHVKTESHVEDLDKAIASNR